MNSPDTPIYTIAQMRAWEHAVVAAGSSYVQLMENAGSRAAADLVTRFRQPQPVLIVCGKGNNGGDGLVMARHLAAAGWAVTVCLLLGGALSPLSALNRALLPADMPVLDATTLLRRLPENGVVIDAVFGTGYRGDLPFQAAQCLQALNCQPIYRVALDIPSGIHGDSGSVATDSFCAHLTYVFQALKPAHLMAAVAAYCGGVVCLNIE